MLDDEDLTPRHATRRERDLSTWSVEELETYIARMEAEIARAREAIEARRAVRGAAESLFKKR